MDVSCDKLCRIISNIFQDGKSSDRDYLYSALFSTPRNPSAPVPFLHSIRQAGARLSAEERRSVSSAIRVLEDSILKPAEFQKVQRALGFEYSEKDQLARLTEQLHHRLLGLLYGVLVAAEFPEQHETGDSTVPHELIEALNSCGRHWDAAWWYHLEDNYTNGRGNGVAGQGRVDDVLSQAVAGKWLQGTWWQHSTTWLTVRRLLMFLLQSDPAAPSAPGEAASLLLPVLWVLRHNDATADQESGGVVRGIRLEKNASSRVGWFPDPVCFGITTFDSDLQKSVEIAGRLAWPRLRDTNTSICIRPADLQNGKSSGWVNPLLSGDSAGGLLGCGLYALIFGENITRGLTASVALRLRRGRDLTPTDTVLQIGDVECVSVGGAVAKLAAAEKAGLNGVALHKDNRIEADSYRSSHPAARCRSETTSTFHELHRYLTRGYQIDLLVAAEAKTMQDNWRKAREGKLLGDFRHQLDVFVEPRISVRVSQPEPDSGRPEEKWETLPAGVEALLNRHLIPSHQWLVIHEDAGGGKTVLSWLLADALCQHERRPWVVRYEGREFPASLYDDLARKLQGKLEKYGVTQTATEVLNDLLEQQRVVVIYDALDQDNSNATADGIAADHRVNKLRTAKADDQLKNRLRLIITSRPYAFMQLSPLADWLECRLELFDELQQSDYRQQVIRLEESGRPGAGAQVEEAYRQLLPRPEDVEDLLRYPVVQAQLRMIIQAQLRSDGRTQLRSFKNAGDLYLEMAYRLLDGAFKSGRYVQETSDKENLIELLSCYGYLMMLQYQNFSVEEDRIPLMHRDVRQRFSGSQEDWERCSKILLDTYLTEHLLLKENGKHELSFPSLKMAEFFAGLYLGRYCDERVIKELQLEIGRGEWNNVWRFVAELPETTNSSGRSACTPNSLCYSLQALFSVPNEGRERPTLAMFRAWQVLQRNAWLKDVREQVLGSWRQQFRQILIEGYEQGMPSVRARTAAEVVFEGDLLAFVKSGKEFEQNRINQRLRELDKIPRPNPREKSEIETLSASEETLDQMETSSWCKKLQPEFPVYALCSNAKTGDPDHLTFMMGASPKDKDAFPGEKPWQEVSVPAFYMATACVTRSQYALFCPQREREESSILEYAPDPDCPMIHVNFHDGMCFGLWLDDRYSLPSEVQWEGAAWGGLDRKKNQDYVIGVPPYTRKFTSAQVNYGEEIGRCVPVRFAKFNANKFGLWQMSGNVGEYTRSEWYDHLSDAIEHRNDDVALGSAEPVRCVRGGSWNYYARFSRCSNRYRYEIRYLYSGIRLSRTK